MRLEVVAASVIPQRPNRLEFADPGGSPRRGHLLVERPFPLHSLPTPGGSPIFGPWSRGVTACPASGRAWPPRSFIDPCLPIRADRAPVGEGWVHEIKHDGFRQGCGSTHEGELDRGYHGSSRMSAGLMSITPSSTQSAAAMVTTASPISTASKAAATMRSPMPMRSTCWRSTEQTRGLCR